MGEERARGGELQEGGKGEQDGGWGGKGMGGVERDTGEGGGGAWQKMGANDAPRSFWK